MIFKFRFLFTLAKISILAHKTWKKTWKFEKFAKNLEKPVESLH